MLSRKMDQKTWLRMKTSLRKSIAVKSEAEVSVKGNNEQEKKFPYKKVALEETVKNLHEQVACLLCECHAKDKLVAEHAKTAQEANAGREKAEAEVAKWKGELEDMLLQQEVAANERLVYLNAALKNCRQQLSCEHDRRVNQHKRLESKYTEARKKLADLTVENARLTKALVKKEEIIEDVNNRMSEATAEFNLLISRLDSTATKRGSKTEYHFLERQLKKRNRRQHQESGKLEAERHRLRLLVRKRIPGHVKPKPKPSNHPKVVDRRMSVMIKWLCEVEEENKILRKSACKRENEIRLLKPQLARMRRDERGDIIQCRYHSNSMEEKGGLTYNLDEVEVHKDLEAKLLESQNTILTLQTQLEHLKESKRMTEDHFENLKLINVHLDHQLSAAKLQIKEALRKVFFLEMELEDRSHHFEGLEATCIELQLQLTSICSKGVASEDVEQEGKLLRTGLEIAELTNNEKLSQHSSLHDHMAADEVEDVLNSPMIKEIISTAEMKEPTTPCYDTCNNTCGVKNAIPRVLPVVPSKQCSKGTELLRNLVFRGKKGSNKKKLLAFTT